MEDSKQPHPIDITVGARVRNARVSRGLSQTALAEELGVSFQQVQKYENGSNRISASRLVEIANMLGVPATSFLKGLGTFSEKADQDRKVSAEAQELAGLYEQLPASMRQAVLQLAHSLAGGPPRSGSEPRGRLRPMTLGDAR